MQIVIEIPEGMYKNMQRRCNEIQAEGYTLENAVLNGIPLSKRHGRIIDESQVTGTFIWDNGYIECYAPTIIEADKAKSEDKE